MILQIPPGVPHGKVLILSDGPHHFAFRILVEPSPVFERNLSRPSDLLLRVPVSYSEALLGAEIRIPTPDRVVELQIPPGTSSGKRFRISGAGMPGMDGEGDGDLFIEITIELPENPSNRNRKLAEEIAAEENPAELRLRLFRS